MRLSPSGKAMQMWWQHNSRVLSGHAEKLFERLWGRDRCPASKLATHMSCGMPLHQASILK